MFSLPLQIEKTIMISKPQEEVFNILSDFNTWPKWSPWLCLEPTSKYVVSGVPGAKGHEQGWSGEFIGTGNMKIHSAQFPVRIEYDLEFLKPWKAKSQVRFELTKSDLGTTVSWVMDGTLPIFVFFMKKMMVALMGSDFDRGLAMLKEYLETGVVKSRLDFKGVVNQGPFFYLGIRTKCAIREVGEKMHEDFMKLGELVESKQIPRPESGISFYHVYDMVKGVVEYTAGFAYSTLPSNKSNIKLEEGWIHQHRSLEVDHYGPYKHLGNGWSAAMSRQRGLKAKVNKSIPWYEVYKTVPGEVEESDLHTEIHLPVKDQ